ncbi:hypothetical protein B0H19DRAFT_1063048 [Mycena capillaripes]|nr:hypothetical protein B0H19DRAFT_1063048 [Mycena capillaripes]
MYTYLNDSGGRASVVTICVNQPPIFVNRQTSQRQSNVSATSKRHFHPAPRNSTLTDTERWDACNSVPASSTAPPPPSPNPTPPTELMRQSYVWDNNSCFIDAPMEAYFRAFIAMGDAVRSAFLRRIRAEAPNTGLRDVLEHMWLRGLLSGAIIGPKSTVTKPSATKLNYALQAGQLNVKRLIETKWDGGQFAAGMAGCAHGDYKKHRKIAAYISVENGMHHGDFFVAGGHIRDGSHQPPRRIPVALYSRERHGTTRVSYPPLHLQAPIPCSHPACDASEAPVTSIATEWPLILRIDPIVRGRGIVFNPTVPDVHCPLTLNLGNDVKYILIARVIYKGATKSGPRSGNILCVILRTSKASITSRTVAEIQDDLAKIPGPSTESIPITDTDDEVDQMIIDSLTSPPRINSCSSPLGSPDQFFTPEQSSAQPPPNDGPNAVGDISHADTDSTTPCPIFCQPCGANIPEGDDDPDEVQGCHEEIAAEFFQPDQIVMLPLLEGGKNWKDPDVLWFPARFVQHHKKRKGQFNEYEFHWLECNDGTVYYSALSNLPILILRTVFRSPKFLQELEEVQLTTDQIGNIRLPFYMKPDAGHINPTLSSIFDAALSQISEILAGWSTQYPVIKSFNRYFSQKKKHLRNREAGEWMRTLRLVPTPELETVLSTSLISLMTHSVLSDLVEEECNTRVMGVGSVLLQFLAIQNELGEPLNLNGDLLEDLVDGSIVACPPDGNEALNAMFSAIPSVSTKSADLVQQMLAFNRSHTIFDEEL